MKFWNPTKKVLLTLLIASFTLFSCNDYNDLDLEESNGNADFSSVVAVGNSLTAGYQSDALYETAQRYSFPALVAGQMEMVQNFEQPLISDPGIGGRIGLNDDLSNPSPTQEQGTPINTDLDRPYNNLGIPGALLADFLGQDLSASNTYEARKDANPFFDIVLRDFGETQAQTMAQLEPTFVMFWLGNNDILGYVTSGGTKPYVPPANFRSLYTASVNTIAQTGAKAVLYNIPDVTSIPYVFLLRSQLEQQGLISFDQGTQTYQMITPQGAMTIYIETANGTREMRANDFLLLSGTSYFADVQSGSTPPPVSPNSPIPNEYVLDGPISSPPSGNSEVVQASTVVSNYNSFIANAANSNGWALVDINSAFVQIFQNFRQSGGTAGITQNGVTLTPVPGSLFSFDGIHPANRGHGIVANMTIEAINSTYNADLPNIDISTIPQGFPVNN
jgi:lysophospholipase L1-like esterase